MFPDKSGLETTPCWRVASPVARYFHRRPGGRFGGLCNSAEPFCCLRPAPPLVQFGKRSAHATATAYRRPLSRLLDPPAVRTGVRCRAPFLLFTNFRGSVAQAKATGVTVPVCTRSPPRCSTHRCQRCLELL